MLIPLKEFLVLEMTIPAVRIAVIPNILCAENVENYLVGMAKQDTLFVQIVAVRETWTRLFPKFAVPVIFNIKVKHYGRNKS